MREWKSALKRRLGNCSCFKALELSDSNKEIILEGLSDEIFDFYEEVSSVGVSDVEWEPDFLVPTGWTKENMTGTWEGAD